MTADKHERIKRSKTSTNASINLVFKLTSHELIEFAPGLLHASSSYRTLRSIGAKRIDITIALALHHF